MPPELQLLLCLWLSCGCHLGLLSRRRPLQGAGVSLVSTHGLPMCGTRESDIHEARASALAPAPPAPPHAFADRVQRGRPHVLVHALLRCVARSGSRARPGRAQVYEVRVDAAGGFTGCHKVMDLKAHRSQARPRSSSGAGRGGARLRVQHPCLRSPGLHTVTAYRGRAGSRASGQGVLHHPPSVCALTGGQASARLAVWRQAETAGAHARTRRAARGARAGAGGGVLAGRRPGGHGVARRTWCVWDLAVRHWLQEDPKKLLQARAPSPQRLPTPNPAIHLWLQEDQKKLGQARAPSPQRPPRPRTPWRAGWCALELTQACQRGYTRAVRVGQAALWWCAANPRALTEPAVCTAVSCASDTVPVIGFTLGLGRQAGQGLGPGACFQRLAFGPGGVVAAAAPGGELHFLDARTGHLLEVREPLAGCWSAVQRAALAWSRARSVGSLAGMQAWLLKSHRLYPGHRLQQCRRQAAAACGPSRAAESADPGLLPVRLFAAAQTASCCPGPLHLLGCRWAPTERHRSLLFRPA